ncbi:DUF2169 domain-containing protein [Marinobacter lacisalsi]|uniref:DUF2169 domain-containing protein n=1 Tax=Marinobacter lacisalsi TaxID=475979 RepID=A0ABV8QLK0_9GAMM
METRIPDITGVDGLFLPGFIKAGGSIRQVASIIVKRSYDIDGSSLVPTDHGKALTLTDRLRFFRENGDEVPPEDARDEDDYLTLALAESDLAPFKPHADLVVKGAYGPGEECEALVDGVRWLHRDHDLFDNPDNLPADVTLDMFGWAPKSLAPRLDAFGTFSEAADTPLPNDFDNHFYNGHSRRYDRGVTMNYFAPDSHIEIRRDIRGADTRLTFNLATATPGASYFYHCGHGRDQASRWCKVPVPLNLDTLIVHPDSDRCQLIWRGHWELEAQPVADYRLLNIQFDETE